MSNLTQYKHFIGDAKKKLHYLEWPSPLKLYIKAEQVIECCSVQSQRA